jgi:ferrochelatase
MRAAALRSNARPVLRCPPMFDAVLMVSFGGPQGPADIRPFLENVLRGRRVSPERVEEVAHHYEHFGGVSPISELTKQQADGLRARLAAEGRPLPVYIGMRNWHPFLADTLREMSDAGIRRAIGVILAAQHSYSSCQQYKENVVDARAALRASGRPDVDITNVESWFDHDLFIETHAAHVREALARLPANHQTTARLVFTAHSIPSVMAEASLYRQQLRAGAEKVAQRAGMRDWTLVYQSRSGRPQDPWLEPDICDYLRQERANGVEAVVISPIGFVCDHIEVLWDLDEEAAQTCREIGIAMSRAATANADPRFIEMLADVVLKTMRRYERGRPLTVTTLPASDRPRA